METLPEGLTWTDLDVYRRRSRDHAEVAADEGRREVVDLFGRTVARALQPGGPVELRGQRAEWERDLEIAREKAAFAGERAASLGEALAALEHTAVHFGGDTPIRDAVGESDSLEVRGVQWTVSRVQGPGGEATTLWRRGRRERDQSLQTRGTWDEAVEETAKDYQDFRDLYLTWLDRIEEADLHAHVIGHVLRLHQRGRLSGGAGFVQARPDLLTDARAFQRFVARLRDDAGLTWRAAYERTVEIAGGTRWASFDVFDRARQRAEQRERDGRRRDTGR